MATVKEHKEVAWAVMLTVLMFLAGFIGGMLNGYKMGASDTYDRVYLLFTNGAREAATILDCKYNNESFTIEKKQPLKVESKNIVEPAVPVVRDGICPPGQHIESCNNDPEFLKQNCNKDMSICYAVACIKCVPDEEPAIYPITSINNTIINNWSN